MKKKIGIILGIALISSSFTAFAATWSKYDTTVGRIGGYGYTSYLEQQTTGASPSVSSAYVGGDYLVDVRAQTSKGNNGSWTIDLGDETCINLSVTNQFKPGSNVRLQFRNKTTTPVYVQVTGNWATH